MKMVLPALVACAIGVSASAEVLFDNLYITDQQLYSLGNGAAIGGYSTFGVDYDLQMADDFVVPGALPYMITDVTMDFIGFLGGSNDVLVEIFADNGGMPAESPIAYAITTPSITPFNDWMGYIGQRMTATLNVQLNAGSYFIAMQPLTCSGFGNGDWYYQLVMDDNNPIGATRHHRDAGQDVNHNGNLGFGPFGGGYGTNDWLPSSGVGYTNGDMVFKVEGYVIPAPGALALLGLAGLARRRRR